MLKQLKNRRLGTSENGFTIIEVMIVLAIAALILVIVFLAVPALQRSSRNTQRSTDGSNSLAAVSNYVSNNNGLLPAACTGNCSFMSDVKLGYFTVANTNFYTTIPSGLSTDGKDPTSEQMFLIGDADCSAGQGQLPQKAQSARSYVVFYGFEGSTKTQCIEG